MQIKESVLGKGVSFNNFILVSKDLENDKQVLRSLSFRTDIVNF